MLLSAQFGGTLEEAPKLHHHLYFLPLLQDVPDTGKAAGEKSVFYLLLKMFVDGSIGALKDSTRLLIMKVCHYDFIIVDFFT